MSWLTAVVPKNVRNALLAAWRAAVASLLAVLLQGASEQALQNASLKAEVVRLSGLCSNNPVPSEVVQRA